MKLIVLYGPSNSGKTTTLKMVYEVLKKLNTKEERRFKYLDPNMYLDFRDVLIIEQRPTITQLLIKEKNSKYEDKDDNEDFEKNYPSMNEESPFYKEGNVSDSTFPDNENDSDEDDSDEDDLKDDDLNDENHVENVLNNNDITPETAFQTSGDTRSIGIILDGDYGCEPGKCVCKKPLTHKRLCNNIQNFQNCDIIICACSQKKSSKKEKPSNCIKWAIQNYKASYYFERSHKFKKSHSRIPYSYYLRREKRLDNRILWDLIHIW